MGNKHKIAVGTLGCKVNQFESAGIIEKLTKMGFTIVPFSNTADIYIINTCAVTGAADYQSRQFIRRAHRKNPEASIIVTGCYAQMAPHEIAGLPGVTIVAGNSEKEKISNIIRNMAQGEQQILVGDISKSRKISDFTVSRFPKRTRAFIRIQDGCNSFCSYCIIPYARGRSRSLPEKDALGQISRLANAGYREIVLSGIHLGIYGQELSPPTNLLNLLRKVEENKTVERLRLGSIEPAEITDEMITHIKNSKVICPHLHIPLQSGDNKILSSMKRNYDAESFKYLIERLLDKAPDMAIGIDVMAGFPGEGEKEFENTLEFIEGLPVAYLHVFPYSERPGTRSPAFTGKVKDDIKKKRCHILRTLGKKKRTAFAGRFTEKKLAVLIEGKKDGKTGLMRGFSENYIPVLVTNGNPSLINNVVDVIADRAEEGKIFGRKVVNG